MCQNSNNSTEKWLWIDSIAVDIVVNDKVFDKCMKTACNFSTPGFIEITVLVTTVTHFLPGGKFDME